MVAQKWTEVTDLGTDIDVFVGADARDLKIHDQITVSE